MVRSAARMVRFEVEVWTEDWRWRQVPPIEGGLNIDEAYCQFGRAGSVGELAVRRIPGRWRPAVITATKR
jgi:hypothetical protein